MPHLGLGVVVGLHHLRPSSLKGFALALFLEEGLAILLVILAEDPFQQSIPLLGRHHLRGGELLGEIALQFAEFLDRLVVLLLQKSEPVDDGAKLFGLVFVQSFAGLQLVLDRADVFHRLAAVVDHLVEAGVCLLDLLVLLGRQLLALLDPIGPFLLQLGILVGKLALQARFFAFQITDLLGERLVLRFDCQNFFLLAAPKIAQNTRRDQRRDQ
ncbi:MAG: hypothetical protein KDN19_20980 [Verrucomicrobiae bacterium]|nr:hypothetical protein [Verrucomicrobiae bacterium]